MKKLSEWSDYQEMPIHPAGAARLTDTERVSLLKKLGISARTDKARVSFMISRRLKG